MNLKYWTKFYLLTKRRRDIQLLGWGLHDTPAEAVPKSAGIFSRVQSAYSLENLLESDWMNLLSITLKVDQSEAGQK